MIDFSNFLLNFITIPKTLFRKTKFYQELIDTGELPAEIIELLMDINKNKDLYDLYGFDIDDIYSSKQSERKDDPNSFFQKSEHTFPNKNKFILNVLIADFDLKKYLREDLLYWITNEFF